jgi:hypothetical protein
MKQTASGWVILTRNLVGGFHPQNDMQTEPVTSGPHFPSALVALLRPAGLLSLRSSFSGEASVCGRAAAS